MFLSHINVSLSPSLSLSLLHPLSKFNKYILSREIFLKKGFGLDGCILLGRSIHLTKGSVIKKMVKNHFSIM